LYADNIMLVLRRRDCQFV